MRTLPLDANTTAVYVSNRGHNSLRLFLLDEASGKLTPKGWYGTDELVWPRSFNVVLGSVGRPALLIAAARGGYSDAPVPGTGNLIVYVVGKNGDLTRSSRIAADSPVAVVSR